MAVRQTTFAPLNKSIIFKTFKTMKKLSLDQMAVVKGGGICEVGGATLVLGAAVLVAGVATIATGGIGLAVAGGLGVYFGNMVGLACLMGAK